MLDQPAAADPQWSGDAPDPSRSRAPYRLYNIGNADSVPLRRYLEVLERELGCTAVIESLPLQAGDVPATEADVRALFDAVGYAPQVPVEEGVARFVHWYRDYHGMAA